MGVSRLFIDLLVIHFNVYAGDEGLRIWDLPDGNPMQTPDYNVNILGQVTNIKWVCGENNTTRLIFGTGLGKVVVWKLDATDVSLAA